MQDEIALLRQQQADSVAAQEAASKPDANPAAAEKPSDGKAAPSPEAADGLVAESGGEAHYIQHPARVRTGAPAGPPRFRRRRDAAHRVAARLRGRCRDHARYVPLHERVNRDGFALLLPNGQRDGAGSRFWNPTDRCCDGGKSGGDDVAYLTELVASARQVGDFGPLYFFGYSNGGFMAYHMACKGLPGLRAVASLAGTSYVEDAACEGAPPVSVLHIHGADGVIRFDGDASQPDAKGAGEPAFYAGARDMVTRWSQRAGCAWPDQGPTPRPRSRPRPAPAGRGDPGVRPAIGLRRRDHDRAVDGPRRRPLPRLRRRLRGGPARLAAVAGVSAAGNAAGGC